MLDMENLEKWEDVHQVKSFCPEIVPRFSYRSGFPPVIYHPVLQEVVCKSGSDHRPH